ncbi:hypothetical protein VTK73DRAFT_9469 [Phialemonium thermophilum]|uniref:Uncharacterized protein n=1 Tax=Phialemonium thermophilum TaxID=223376 RepID=A0ABR3W1X1_9PEZI
MTHWNRTSASARSASLSVRSIHSYSPCRSPGISSSVDSIASGDAPSPMAALRMFTTISAHRNTPPAFCPMRTTVRFRSSHSATRLRLTYRRMSSAPRTCMTTSIAPPLSSPTPTPTGSPLATHMLKSELRASRASDESRSRRYARPQSSDTSTKMNVRLVVVSRLWVT